MQGGTLDAGALPSDGAPGDAQPPGGDASAGICPIPGCPAIGLPAGTDLNGVWIAPTGEVWAVGESGIVGRREPDAERGQWCWCAAGPDVPLRAVWGSAGKDVWIVGAAGTALHFGGTGFTTVDVQASASLNDVWGSSSSDIFVVGEAGTVRHFDGASWASADVGAEHTLRGVWGSSATSVWAVGSIPVHDPDAPSSGAEAEIFRWDAASNSYVRQASFLELSGAAYFDGISGSGPDDVWAVGLKVPSGAAAGFAFAARFDGTTWTSAGAPEEERINRNYTDVAVHAPGAPAGAWITSSSNTAVIFDGTSWKLAEDATSDLLAVDVRGDKMWTGGRDGKVLRRGASGWVVDLPARPATVP